MFKPSRNFNNLEEFDFQSGGSSKGVLAKCFTEDPDGRYLLKTGSFLKPNFSKLEPVTECICSDLADLFKISHANYELVECYCKDSDLWKSKKVLVCKTKLFTDENNVLIHGDKIIGNERDYDVIAKTLGDSMKLDLDNMIVFDYLVNNTDRHHANFGILVNTKDRTRNMAPMYDHGFSLLTDFDSDYLEDELFEIIYDDCDYSKLCDKSNFLQLGNVNKFSLNLEFSEEEVNSIFFKYSKYIDSWRIELMLELFNRRLSHVREIFTKVGEYYIRRDK